MKRNNNNSYRSMWFNGNGICQVEAVKQKLNMPKSSTDSKANVTVGSKMAALVSGYPLPIEYVRVFKSLFMTEVNALYTYDAHQFEALLICRQMPLLS